ncbi:hypothetical protein IG631_09458 [Alternaria alternata]|jgi:hypothetical protein|nr:hypothetical protein IG631_09458 [Alternaria alternata]
MAGEGCSCTVLGAQEMGDGASTHDIPERIMQRGAARESALVTCFMASTSLSAIPVGGGQTVS